MLEHLHRGLLFALGGLTLAGSIRATPAAPRDTPEGAPGNVSAIRATMAAYNAALNGGRTDAVMPLYAADGVFMAPYGTSAVGQAAVRAAYDRVFGELGFDVRFDVVEIVPMAPDWAFVRTNSAGTTLHHATGRTTAEANQELFVLHRDGDGTWRIARYSFSPTSPPAP